MKREFRVRILGMMMLCSLSLATLAFVFASAQTQQVYWLEGCNNKSVWTVDDSVTAGYISIEDAIDSDWYFANSRARFAAFNYIFVDGGWSMWMWIKPGDGLHPARLGLIRPCTQSGASFVPSSGGTYQYYFCFYVNVVQGYFPSGSWLPMYTPHITVRDASGIPIGGVALVSNSGSVKALRVVPLHGTGANEWSISAGQVSSLYFDFQKWHKFEIWIEPAVQRTYVDGALYSEDFAARQNAYPAAVSLYLGSLDTEAEMFIDTIYFSNSRNAVVHEGDVLPPGGGGSGSGFDLSAWIRDNWLLIIIALVVLVILLWRGGK